MIAINKKNIVKIGLIIVVIVLILTMIALYYISKEPEKITPSSNVATLKTSNTVKETEEKEEEIKEDIEPEPLTVYNSSNELMSLNNSGWNYQNTDIKGDYETDNTNYYYEGFTLTREKNRITRIVFDEKYGKEIVKGIYVGMDFNNIKDILGEPIFENQENNMMGYITQNLFMCIYEDEIAVYQNKFYYNNELEEMILKYYNNQYPGNANDFSRYIRNNYDDFVFSSDEERNIYLTSMVRGIVIKLDDSIKVYLYKNYDSAQLLEQNMSENIEYTEQYMAELIENERNLEQ